MLYVSFNFYSEVHHENKTRNMCLDIQQESPRTYTDFCFEVDNLFGTYCDSPKDVWA
jgi:hypothetical protein